MEHLLHLISPHLTAHLANIYSITVMTWVSLAAVVAVLMAVVKVLIRQIQIRRVARQFESPPRHWLYGHMQLMSGETAFFEMMKLIHDLNAQVLQIWLGPFFPFTQCCHPDSIRAVLSKSEPKAGTWYKFIKPWVGDGLLVSEGSKWHRNRRLVTPAFHFQILKSYIKLFAESTNVLIEKWTNLDDGSSVEMFEHVTLMTLDSILKCSMTSRTNCQIDGQAHPFVKAVGDLLHLMEERMFYPPFHNDFIFYLSPSGRRFRQALAVVHGFSEKVIKERRAQLGKDKERGLAKSGEGRCLDFLDILLEAKDEDGAGLTDVEIQDEVDTFLNAGHETVASGISWTLYHLAKHPEYQDRCRREADEVLQGRTEMVWEDLSNLPFITMCIKESMRRRPPVPGIAREQTQTLALPDGRKLPAGWIVHVSILQMHGNPHVWPNPEVYDPLRFTPENSKGRHPYAFLPFAAGTRNCIGQRFAMAEMIVTVALILQHFNLELDGPSPRIRQRITLGADNGIWLKIHPRK